MDLETAASELLEGIAGLRDEAFGCRERVQVACAALEQAGARIKEAEGVADEEALELIRSIEALDTASEQSARLAMSRLEALRDRIANACAQLQSRLAEEKAAALELAQDADGRAQALDAAFDAADDVAARLSDRLEDTRHHVGDALEAATEYLAGRFAANVRGLHRDPHLGPVLGVFVSPVAVFMARDIVEDGGGLRLDPRLGPFGAILGVGLDSALDAAREHVDGSLERLRNTAAKWFHFVTGDWEASLANGADLMALNMGEGAEALLEAFGSAREESLAELAVAAEQAGTAGSRLRDTVDAVRQALAAPRPFAAGPQAVKRALDAIAPALDAVQATLSRYSFMAE